MPRPHAPCQPPRSGPSGCGTDERLLFSGPDSFKQLDSAIAGAGIAGTSGKELAGRDGRVIWKVYRDETDELGMRHVFYRQHLLPSGRLAEALGEPYVSEGIPVLGGEIGVHTLADGTPRAVFGRQYREVSVAAVPAITTATEALAAAMGAAETLDSRAAWRAVAWSAAEADWAHSQTRLVLASESDGELRLVWEVPVQWDDRQLDTVRLDAATGKALGTVSLSQSGTCDPGPTQVSIGAQPQNSALYTRTLPAAVATERTAPWTHEAARQPETGWTPAINVYLRILSPNDPAQEPYQCRPPGEDPRYWGILPLQSPGGQGRYEDYSAPAPLEVRGRSAGDALHHTHLTMETLRSTFGRCGFTGSCSDPASIVIESRQWTSNASRGMAKFEQWPTTRIPTGRGVVVYARQNMQYQDPIYPFEASASLDVIAHEWGHGVAHGVGLPASGEQAQLHEGFANVLGHAVEWLNHPPGNGFEKADWCFGEDHNTGSWPSGATCPAYWSRADWFQEVVNHTGETSYYLYHDAQPLPQGASAGDPHVRGHMLAVVHYLLSAGGKNPICPAAGRGGIPGPWVTTSCHDVSGLGVTKASKILMGVLTWYATPNTQWADLPELAKFVAFDLYSRCWQGPCGFSALWEQAAVRQAFAAIGYDDPTGPIDCGRCP